MGKDSLENLWIWREAIALSTIIYKVCRHIKDQEMLVDQIDRSSQSVGDNIAEMYGSYYCAVKKNALRIARKEAYETINHLEKIKLRGCLNIEECDQLQNRYNVLILGINRYIGYISEFQSKGLEKK